MVVGARPGDELTPAITIAGKYNGPACDSNILESLAVADMIYGLVHLSPEVPITASTNSQSMIR